MIEALKKQLRVQREDWITGLVIVLAGALLGEVILQCVMRFSGEQDTYFELGTVFAGMMAVMYSAIMSLTMFGIYFNMEVSMGCTRKKFFLSFFGVNVLANLVYVAVVCLICGAENALCRACFPGMGNEVDFLPYIVKWGIPMAVLLPMVMNLCSVVLMRCGAKARGILLVAWLVLCIGGPRISEAVEEAPDSIFGRIGKGIIWVARLLPGDAWIFLAGLIGLVCFGVSYRMVKRQQVTL